MHNPFFSIIIPTFNSEKTLQGALNSIIDQGFADFEIIIIDGKSGDNTISLIEENCRVDTRIGYVSEEDNGIYDAMNKGIDVARGQWLYFLGSDDSFSDKKVLQAVADGLKDCRCDFFYGEVMMKGIKYGGQFTLEKLLIKNISHQAIFYRRQLFEKMGKYNTRFKLHADWEFNIRYFLQFGNDAKYRDILIANFGEGGVSSAHDILFLREFLLPVKMQQLPLNPGYFKKIIKYDEWWRLIRNANIHSLEQLRRPGPGYEIPLALQKMITMQRLFPPRWLRIGVMSKLLMFGSYMVNLFAKGK